MKNLQTHPQRFIRKRSNKVEVDVFGFHFAKMLPRVPSFFPNFKSYPVVEIEIKDWWITANV
jgi:hypothetical protein